MRTAKGAGGCTAANGAQDGAQGSNCVWTQSHRPCCCSPEIFIRLYFSRRLNAKPGPAVNAQHLTDIAAAAASGLLAGCRRHFEPAAAELTGLLGNNILIPFPLATFTGCWTHAQGELRGTIGNDPGLVVPKQAALSGIPEPLKKLIQRTM